MALGCTAVEATSALVVCIKLRLHYTLVIHTGCREVLPFGSGLLDPVMPVPGIGRGLEVIAP